MHDRIRILIADDHTMMRQALRYLLEVDERIEVIGDVASGREAIEASERLLPDVVLMDLVMPGLNGLEATQVIRKRFPRIKVLVLSGYMEDEQIIAALRAGASGYVVKNAEVTELVLAIQAVQQGNTYFSSMLLGSGSEDYLWQAKQPPENIGFEALTSREREILQLVTEGASNKGIAKQLFISIKTVEAHVANNMQKLHAGSRAGLIRLVLSQDRAALLPQIGWRRHEPAA
jgi:two-component system response regulator NreC